MDKYDVNSFFRNDLYLSGTRVEVYPNKDIGQELIDAYNDHGFQILHFGRCLKDGDDFVSLEVPNVMKCVDEAIANSDDGFLIVGLDALLSMRPEGEASALANLLKERVEQGRNNRVAYLIHYSNLDRSAFVNRRFVQGGQVVYFEGEEIPYERPTIDIVSPHWLTEGFAPDEYQTATSLKELFEKLGTVCSSGKYVLLIEPKEGRINSRAINRTNAKDVAERFYQIKADFSPELYRVLLVKSVERNLLPLDFLKQQIGERNLNETLAPAFLFKEKGNPLWDAFAWTVLRNIPSDSYLSYIFKLGVDRSNFLRKYFVEGVLGVLKDNEEKLFVGTEEQTKNLERLKNLADERKRAICVDTSIPEIYLPFFSELVSLVQNYDSAFYFLNCETDVEKREIIRRISNGGFWDGLSGKYKGMLPLLDSYLSQEKCYPDPDLEEYFREYRRLKICDDVSESFIRRAFEESDKIVNYKSRTLAFGEYDSRIGNGLATIVVDAMGAEFLPLLLAEARRRGLFVADSRIVRANLPTSTDFNEIDNEYNPIHFFGWDDVVHNGARKNESCSVPENLLAGLKKFYDVFEKIQDALTNNQYVIVTADHGSSRLAKIAWEKQSNLVRTLDKQIECDPDDWRYEQNAPDKIVPEEVIQQIVPATNVTYWVVRGYNRFPKSGGKKNEMHGGATLEEALVPFVVFSRDPNNNILSQNAVSWTLDKTTVEKQDSETAVIKQIVEDPDFDI